MTTASLRDRVYESLNNAVENGHDPLLQSVQQNTFDLLTYDADLEDAPESDVHRFVREWMDFNREIAT